MLTLEQAENGLVFELCHAAFDAVAGVVVRLKYPAMGGDPQ